MAEWIAQISRHEKGFWQADLFHGDYAEEPETFFTSAMGASMGDCIAKAKIKWPLAEIRVVEDDETDDEQE